MKTDWVAGARTDWVVGAGIGWTAGARDAKAEVAEDVRDTEVKKSR